MEENSYLLKGDISGIQDFIFDVPSKGAAKQLKARSFQIQMYGWLAEALVLERIPTAKQIYNGGGNFYLLIPEEDWDVAVIESLRQQMLEALRVGNLTICLGYVQVQTGQTYAAQIEEVNRVTSQVKLSPHVEIENSDLHFHPFINSERYNQETYKKFTSKLSRSLSWEISTQGGKDLNSLNHLCVNLHEKEATNAHHRLYRQLPIWQNDEAIAACDSFFKDEKQEDPTFEQPKVGDVIGFEYLAFFAKQRTGTGKLGILKLDVDNLGSIFTRLENQSNNQFLSKQLSIFFSEHLDKLLDETFTYRKRTTRDGQPIQKVKKLHNYDRKGKVDSIKYYEVQEHKAIYRHNLYIVFAGGDDCFIVGAWDAILEFMILLRKRFESFQQDKILKELPILAEPITLSASVHVVDAHYPVVQFSNLAEEGLHAAKTTELNHDRLDASGKAMKNCFSLMGKVFSWDDIEKLIALRNKLLQMILEYGEGKAFLHRMMELFESPNNRQWRKWDKPFDPAILWRFVYHFRNISQEAYFRHHFYDYFFEKPGQGKSGGIYYRYLWNYFEAHRHTSQVIPVAARWVELLTKNT